MQTHCPQCSDGRSGYHLGFNIKYGNFNCWRCRKVRQVEAIRGLLHCTMEKAFELRAQYSDPNASKRTRKVQVQRSRRVQAPPHMDALKRRHVDYLHDKRGLRNIDALAELWEMQGTEHYSGDWSWRVISPIRSSGGKLQAYVGRSIIPETKEKYRLTEGKKCAGDPEGFLYGIHHVPDRKRIIVVEGPGDVWNMGPGTVATMGIDWRRKQACILREYDARFIMYDPEPLAQKQAQALADWLSLFPGTTEIIDGLPSDPGSIDRKLVRKIRRELLGE